ncbi:hypothetical protein ACFL10_02175 [Patescibacteria group bacterium]
MFLGMRAVMQVGGFCAEGGPYHIAVPCPQGIAVLMPLSIFAMLIGGALYFTAPLKNGPKWGFLFWSALFIALGWNFFEFGIYPPIGEGISIAWLVCGVLFALMGIGPLLVMNRDKASNILLGSKKPDESFNVKLLLMHIVALAAGIYLGLEVYKYFT